MNAASPVTAITHRSRRLAQDLTRPAQLSTDDAERMKLWRRRSVRAS